MKITRRQLRRIIREERQKLNEYYPAPEFTPEEQAVIDAMADLEILLANMGQGNPDLTDYYVNLFRAMKKHAGVDPAMLGRLA